MAQVTTINEASSMRHFSVLLISITALVAIAVGAKVFYAGDLRLSEHKVFRDGGLVGVQKRTDPCSYLPEKEKKLIPTEAIRLAECFIIQNGYTDAKLPDNTKLRPESVNPEMNDLTMSMRHDSLERAAYGYMRSTKHADGWIVVFRKKRKTEVAKLIPDYEERIKRTGRAVSMDAYGRAIEVEHQDFSLDSQRLLKLPENR